MNKLPTLNAEERQALLEKGRLAKLAKKTFAEEHLKLDWQDESFWRSTAAELGVKLPQRYDVGPRGVKKVAKKLGININEWVEITGFTTLTALCNANKTFPSFAITGLMLEWFVEENKD